jgi:hypothetical protein
LRRRATIARKAIAQILETVAEYGFGGEEWVLLQHDTQTLIKALRLVAAVLNAIESRLISSRRGEPGAGERPVVARTEANLPHRVGLLAAGHIMQPIWLVSGLGS